MRVLDHRGVFSRPAGANSKYKCANDIPYGGGSIGEWIPDAIRNITGYLGIVGHDAIGHTGAFAAISVPGYNLQEGGGTGLATIDMNISRVVPTALENRPASISSFLCIKY
jgi:hypothetical protein